MYDFTQLVKIGWDDYARTTRAERDISSEYPMLKIFSGLLPKNSKILDVGCGSGKPITKYFFDKGFSVLGFDISPLQAKKARLNLGHAKIFVADIKTHEFEDNAYEGIICLHSIEHVERIWHGVIFKKMYSALKPGGLLLISIQKDSCESVKFLNPYIQMYYSHFDQFETVKLITTAGFSIIYKSPIRISGEESVYAIAKKEEGVQPPKDPHTVYTSGQQVLG